MLCLDRITPNAAIEDRVISSRNNLVIYSLLFTLLHDSACFLASGDRKQPSKCELATAPDSQANIRQTKKKSVMHI